MIGLLKPRFRMIGFIASILKAPCNALKQSLDFTRLLFLALQLISKKKL